jgi:hypothetical protein
MSVTDWIEPWLLTAVDSNPIKRNETEQTNEAVVTRTIDITTDMRINFWKRIKTITMNWKSFVVFSLILIPPACRDVTEGNIHTINAVLATHSLFIKS